MKGKSFGELSLGRITCEPEDEVLLELLGENDSERNCPIPSLAGIFLLRLTAFLASLSPAKLPVSYRSSSSRLAPILTPPTFATCGVGLIC